MKHQNLLLMILCAMISHCAQNRPVEKVKDINEQRYAKSDLLISDPWLMRVTVTKTSAMPTLAFVGQQNKERSGFFSFTKDHLEFKTSIGPEQNNDHVATVLNRWPISHSEYTLQEVGGKKTNVEVENNDLSWEEKNFFKINWAASSISDSINFFRINDNTCWINKGSYLVDESVEVSTEFIGFTLASDYELNPRCLDGSRYYDGNLTQTVHFSYSYRPLKNTTYSPYLYTGEDDPLMKKYGFFNTVTWNYDEYNVRKNHFLMNRWDPNKTHDYYFSEDFPEKYKWIFNDPEKGIFPLTNKLFADNGLKIRFNINENDGTKKFGDSRYSFVHIIEDKEARGPLGYGPTTANPHTGEIIGGNLLVWTSDLEWYIKATRTQLEQAKKSQSDSPIFQKMKLYLGDDLSTWTSTSENLSRDNQVGSYFDLFLPDYTYHPPGSLFASNYQTVDQTLAAQKPLVRSYDELLSFIPKTHTELQSNLLQNHDQLFEEMYASSNPANFLPHNSTIFEMDAAFQSARNMILDGLSDEEIKNRIVYRTAIHEFGHQLSLRHNFYGSVDVKNFRENIVQDEISYPQMTSSVMDYGQFADGINFHYGFEPYDEAAIIYAYSNGSKDLSVDRNTNYLYCTDEHAFLNPLCNRFDRGSTPSEIILSLIEDYDNNYPIRNLRYDRSYWRTYSYSSQIFSLMYKLKSFVKFEEEAYNKSDLDIKIAEIEEVSGNQVTAISSLIKQDIRRGMLIAAAFYSSVMQQGVNERSYLDRYNTFNGSLEVRGILEDKFFAARFLLGDDGFSLNPNRGVIPTSFLSYQSDPIIGSTLATILDERMQDPGPIYTGFDSIFRTFYALNAAYWRDNGGTESSISRLRVDCFTPESFASKFNIDDIYSFSQNGEAAHAIVLENLDLSRLNDNADDYFRTGSSEAAIIKLNGNFYAASKELNPFSYDLIQKRDASEILQLYLMYHQLTEGHIPECR